MKVLDIIDEAKRRRKVPRSAPAPVPPTPTAPASPPANRDERIKKRDALRQRKITHAKRMEQLKDIKGFLSKADSFQRTTAGGFTAFGEHVKTNKALYYTGKLSASTMGVIRWLGLIEIYQEYMKTMATFKACKELDEDSLAYDEMHLTDEEYTYAVSVYRLSLATALLASEVFTALISGLIRLMGAAGWIARLGGTAAGAVTLGLGTIAIWGLTSVGVYYFQQLVQKPEVQQLIAQFVIYIMTPDDDKGPIDHWGQGLVAAFKGVPADKQRDLWKPPPGQKPGDRTAPGALIDIGKNLTNQELESRIKAVQLKITTAEDEGEKEKWNDILTKLRAEQIRRKTQVSKQPEPGDVDADKSNRSNSNMPDRDFDQQTQDMLQRLQNLPK